MFDASPDELGSSRGFIATAALAVGLLTGFAGGYVTSQRNQAVALPDVQRLADGDSPVASVAPEEPAQTYTDTPVAEGTPEVVTAEAATSGRPGVVRAAPRASTPPAQPPGRTGTLVVVSRPSGAEVFLDERLVGATPLSLDGVAAGAHSVRIALPDHRRWATSVAVTPGASVRVAASLER